MVTNGIRHTATCSTTSHFFLCSVLARAPLLVGTRRSTTELATAVASQQSTQFAPSPTRLARFRMSRRPGSPCECGRRRSLRRCRCCCCGSLHFQVFTYMRALQLCASYLYDHRRYSASAAKHILTPRRGKITSQILPTKKVSPIGVWPTEIGADRRPTSRSTGSLSHFRDSPPPRRPERQCFGTVFLENFPGSSLCARYYNYAVRSVQ